LGGDVELSEAVLEVFGDGALADVQRAGDVAFGLAVRDREQPVRAGGQRERDLVLDAERAYTCW
jgi:hypothetical protein